MELLMIEFRIDADQIEKVNRICTEKGYHSMNLNQLKDVIKTIDKSENQALVHHSLMATKDQIIDFLYGYEWSTMFDLDITN
jgi:hypothetical protein